VTGGVPTILGQVKSDRRVNRAECHLREWRPGSFSSYLAFPVLVKADKADAHFENGILTLTLPKADQVKPKTITVKAERAPAPAECKPAPAHLVPAGFRHCLYRGWA